MKRLTVIRLGIRIVGEMDKNQEAKIVVVNPQDHPGWNESLLSFPDYSIFHTTWWAKVLVETYRFRPRYLVLHRDFRLLSIIPVMEIRIDPCRRKGVALPFTDFCPVLHTYEPGVKEFFMKLIHKQVKHHGWCNLEIRGDIASRENDTFFCSRKYICHGMRLSTDRDRLFGRLKSINKRNIRKAINAGITVVHDNNMDRLRDYYKLHCLTRKKHGLPPQPFSFFLNIHRYILKQGRGFISLAMFTGKPIAGAIFLDFGKKALYKFGASNPRYLYLRPNNLVIWDAICHYAERGYTDFSFGRTDTENTGLLDFKNQWGAEEIELRYSVTNSSFAEHHSGYGQKVLNEILRHLPVSVLRLVGKLFYRFMG